MVFGDKAATVCLYRGAADIQAQPQALGFGGEKRFEQLRLRRGCKARAVIRHAHENVRDDRNRAVRGGNAKEVARVRPRDHEPYGHALGDTVGVVTRAYLSKFPEDFKKRVSSNG